VWKGLWDTENIIFMALCELGFIMAENWKCPTIVMDIFQVEFQQNTRTDVVHIQYNVVILSLGARRAKISRIIHRLIYKYNNKTDEITCIIY
jgi:hypothetical protein